MLRLALMFLIVALVAGFLGFAGIVDVSVNIARILFAIFLVLFLVTAILHILQGKTPPLL